MAIIELSFIRGQRLETVLSDRPSFVLRQGETFDIPFTVRERGSRNLWDLGADGVVSLRQSLRYWTAENPYPTTILRQVVATSERTGEDWQQGEIVFQIADKDIQVPGRYIYDIFATYGNGNERMVVAGDFDVRPAVGFTGYVFSAGIVQNQAVGVTVVNDHVISGGIVQTHNLSAGWPGLLKAGITQVHTVGGNVTVQFNLSSGIVQTQTVEGNFVLGCSA